MIKRDPRTKPPVGAVIDWSDPITDRLVAAFPLSEGGGDVSDAVSGLMLARTGSVSWTSGVRGTRTRVDATGECFRAVTPTRLRLQYPLTLMLAGWQTGSPDSFATFGGVTADDADNAPYTGYTIYSHTTSFAFGSNNGSFSPTISGVFTGTPNTSRWLAGTISASGAISLYIDSTASPTTNTISGTISYATNSSVGVGEPWAASGRNSNFDCDYMYVWSRALSVPELDRVRNEPYPFFDSMTGVTTMFLSAGGGGGGGGKPSLYYQRMRVG
jgi:hypothetical protein